jgi:hypothetical protein
VKLTAHLYPLQRSRTRRATHPPAPRTFVSYIGTNIRLTFTGLPLPKNERDYFMFEFPCIISRYYIKNQQDATLEVLFISNCKITLHVSDAFCVHYQDRPDD